MWLKIELVIVLTMLAISVIDLIRAVVWEVQDLIEEWKDINDVE